MRISKRIGMVYELVDPHVAHIVRDAVAHASERPGGRASG
jgi:hypothetical protein